MQYQQRPRLTGCALLKECVSAVVFSKFEPQILTYSRGPAAGSTQNYSAHTLFRENGEIPTSPRKKRSPLMYFSKATDHWAFSSCEICVLIVQHACDLGDLFVFLGVWFDVIHRFLGSDFNPIKIFWGFTKYIWRPQKNASKRTTQFADQVDWRPAACSDWACTSGNLITRQTDVE